jgi:hypothetical protein
MAHVYVKPEKVVSAGLGLLARELTIPQLVWKNPVGDFTGAKNDTINIKVPAYATARTRTLRAGTARTRDDLDERSVAVVLDTDVYKDVVITDENLTLDIVSFGEQVLTPVMDAVARKLEDIIVAEIEGATYANTVEFDAADPFASIVEARKALNNARVPMSGRSLVVGSNLEAALIVSDRFSRQDSIGPAAATALGDAKLGRIAGFDVFTSPAIDPDEGYAFHKTAFTMSTVAPAIPAGAPWGATMSHGGFALRVVRVLDSADIVDVLATDAYVGTSVVTDRGALTNGVFEPAEDASGGSDLFVRAVKIVDLVS